MNIPRLVLGFVLGIALLQRGQASDQERNNADSSTLRFHASYVADFSDPVTLAAWADDVFVGRVIQIGGLHFPDGSLPETLYTVDVIETLKGDVDPRVTVNQQGGFLPARLLPGEMKKGQWIVLDDDHLLALDETYLFATRRNPDTGWRTSVPGYGNQPLPDDPDEFRVDPAYLEFSHALDRVSTPLEEHGY